MHTASVEWIALQKPLRTVVAAGCDKTLKGKTLSANTNGIPVTTITGNRKCILRKHVASGAWKFTEISPHAEEKELQQIIEEPGYKYHGVYLNWLEACQVKNAIDDVLKKLKLYPGSQHMYDGEEY